MGCKIELMHEKPVFIVLLFDDGLDFRVYLLIELLVIFLVWLVVILSLVFILKLDFVIGGRMIVWNEIFLLY